MERSAILCPHCGAIESIQSVTCHRCGGILGKVAEPSEYFAFLRRDDVAVKTLQWIYSIVFLTTLVIAVQNGGTPLEAFLPGEAFQESIFRMGALSGVAVLQYGEWYRILTATFAHFGIIHLFFNSMALGAVGPESEKNLGKGRFVFVYLASGILANLVSLWWHHDVPTFQQVGASGAICGLMGSLYSVAKMRGGIYDQVVRRIVTRWIVLTVILGFALPGVDNVAHIAGMVSGMILTRLVGIQRPRDFFA